MTRSNYFLQYKYKEKKRETIVLNSAYEVQTQLFPGVEWLRMLDCLLLQ